MSLKKPCKKEAIKRSMSGIGRHLSRGADRVADIIVEDDKGRGLKRQMIADEAALMFKDVKQQFRDNTRDVRPQDLVADAAFCVGRASGIIGRSVRSFFKDLE